MRAVSIDGREQLQWALDCMTDRSHKQGGWARERTECAELQAREDGGGAAGGAPEQTQEIPKEGLGRQAGQRGFGQWPLELLRKPTDEWKKIIRSLLLSHRLAIWNLLIIKCTMSWN